MVFGGIQKLTLLDYPDKTACTLFTVGCNFYCPFCQNASIAHPTGNVQTISAAEVLSFLNTRKGLLDGVCISGGEPLIHDELDAFIGDIKALGFLVKLDTNGSYPDKLKELVKSGAIDYVAMDVKNSLEKYGQTIGIPDYDTSLVEESVEFLLSGEIPHEFRTTVVRELHTGDDLKSLARWISGAEKYFIQGFVDSGEVKKSGLSGYSKAEINDLLLKVRTILPNAEIRGY